MTLEEMALSEMLVDGNSVTFCYYGCQPAKYITVDLIPNLCSCGEVMCRHRAVARVLVIPHQSVERKVA
jgi:hypothetical protein